VLNGTSVIGSIVGSRVDLNEVFGRKETAATHGEVWVAHGRARHHGCHLTCAT
jgi:hypothetical protein